MSHFREVCQFGFTHSQCRCPSKDKSIRYIICTIDKHREEYVAQAGE